MEQVRKLSGAVVEGRYDELLEILGRPQDKSLADGLEQGENDELNVVEGLLLADASGHIVRHPYVNNQLNKLLARWAFRVATGGGFRLPAFALMDDGYLFLKTARSSTVPTVSRAQGHRGSDLQPGLCVRYPIRMFDDLLPFESLSNSEIETHLRQSLCRQNCAMSKPELEGLIARQLRLEGTYILHSDTAKKNGGDYDFDWICVIEADRFPRFVNGGFAEAWASSRAKPNGQSEGPLVQPRACGHEGQRKSYRLGHRFDDLVPGGWERRPC